MALKVYMLKELEPGAIDQMLLLTIRHMMSVYTGQRELFGTYSPQDKSQKQLRAQNATTFLQEKKNSANGLALSTRTS
jgi:hypothetical protein